MKEGITIFNENKQLEKVYDYLYSREDIRLVDAPFLKTVKALTSIDSDPKHECWIAVNYKALSSEREELCVLEEERAHYEVGIIPSDSFSNSLLNKTTRERNELKAKKKAVERLVPRDKLLKVMKDLPCIYIEALADAFEVTNEFMADALKVYNLEIV